MTRHHMFLDPAIEVACGLDVDSLWERFEIFEALHHTMSIDSPMSSSDLDAVVDIINPVEGDFALDLACGRGELLRRLGQKVAVIGTGVDLSPWMLRAAHRLSADAKVVDLTWALDDAKEAADARLAVNEQTNLTTCLGGSWVWHGFDGTLRTLAQLTEPGGRIAIGDMHLRDELDPEVVSKTHGAVDSVAKIEASFATHGLDIIGRVNTSDEAWDEYLGRTREAAQSWAQLHPGERAESFVAEQREWEHDHARDREILTWSVWVALKR